MSTASTNLYGSSGDNDKMSNDKDGSGRIRLVLLDRDGVINEDVGSPGVMDPQQLILTPGAGPAVGQLKRAGLKVAIITNQSCVGKQLIDAAKLKVIQARVQELLRDDDSDATWDALYESLTTTAVVDPRRKPAPGMILEACHDFGVSPAETVFVGDTLTDLQAARAAGVPRRVLVSTGYGRGIMEEAGLLVRMPEERQEGQGVVDLPNPIRNRLYDSTDSTSNKTVSHPLETVMPFVFVSNLRSASDWILSQL